MSNEKPLFERTGLFEHVDIEPEISITRGTNRGERAKDAETHRADISDVDELLVTKARRPIVHLDFGRVDEHFAGPNVRQVQPEQVVQKPIDLCQLEV